MEAHICARSGGLPGAIGGLYMETLGEAKPIPRDEMKLNEQEQEFAYKLATSNVRFEKASPARKRVIIAKDVLTWLKAGKIVAELGTYIGRPYTYGVDVYKVVSSSMRVNGDECRACALGAIFACAVERAGGVNGFWEFRSWDVRNKLSQFFSMWQLQLIETAFEASSGFANIPAHLTENREEYEAHRNTRERAILFASKKDPTNRMQAIMENVIANKGTFVP